MGAVSHSDYVELCPQFIGKGGIGEHVIAFENAVAFDGFCFSGRQDDFKAAIDNGFDLGVVPHANPLCLQVGYDECPDPHGLFFVYKLFLGFAYDLDTLALREQEKSAIDCLGAISADDYAFACFCICQAFNAEDFDSVRFLQA